MDQSNNDDLPPNLDIGIEMNIVSSSSSSTKNNNNYNNNNNNLIEFTVSGADDLKIPDYKNLPSVTSPNSFDGLSSISSINEDLYKDLKNLEESFNKVTIELEGESRKLSQSTIKDVEKADSEEFKLRKYFENSLRMQMDNGHKVKRMGVSLKNLTVVGQGAESSVIADVLTPFKALANLFNPFYWRTKTSTFDILHDINGFIEDGKMLLVLGRPGSGCSTLLRIISNQRDSYVAVNGDVKYGNIPAEKWAQYRGEAIYTPEEDIHHPTLTVHQTLDFALKLKTPGKLLPDETKTNFREKIYDLLVNMFGLVKQRDTMVGNEFLRGLSGGERKRATIAEAMVSGASITCFDASTRGLDAASALDYAKSLRIMSDTLKKTTIASFYQASDSIYSLFDKVMILDKGRCIYFGPTTMAKQYFLDLGFHCEERKSIPDFITGVTNPQERIIREDFKDKKVPETSADLEEAWKQSPLYHQALEQQKSYEDLVEQEQPSKSFIEQVLNQTSKTSFKRSNSPYTASFFHQVWALTQRQFQLVYGNKFTIYSRFATVFVQSWIFGSVYFNQALDTSGLFTRGGAVFSSVIFCCILTQGELHSTFFGRRILQKHISYALYRPSAHFLAQVIIDIPLSILQCTLHAIIAYFMYGFDYNAGKFFIFLFTLVGVSLASASLFRAFGNYTPSLFIGQNLMNVVFIFMVNYVSYSIPYDKMKPYFKWFTWVNPLGYAFKAILENEFKDQQFSCQQSAIPYGPGYTDDMHRVCPIPGSVEGVLFVSGPAYIETEFQMDVSDRTMNVFLVYVLWLFYIGLNIIAVEYLDWTGGGYTHKVYKKGKAPKINDVEEEKNINKTVQEATSKMKENLSIKGGIFTWKNIKYTVPVKEGTRLLLDDVQGWIKPGQMTALMGSSGAGKTTLLDVLAKRKTMGTIEGESYLNGKPLAIDFERITGYVEQMDVHNPGLTVREALRFSAKLRQEPEVPVSEKYDYVEKVLEMMEMKHLGDALVGSLETGIGISVEERKRLTIGLELVARPHILFLDEPTSGLDAQSSYNIIKFIRKLADAGMPLVCTIHQPSPVLFEHFDRILLLARGGKTVYFGDIGEKSSTLINYFQRNGARKALESENPAEYILEAIGAGVHGNTDVDWPEVWKQSPEFQSVTQELTQPTLYQENNAELNANQAPREFSRGFAYQFVELYKKLNLIWWRDPFYTFGTWFQMATSGLIVGFTFWQLEDSSSDLVLRTFFIWEGCILGVLLIYSALPQFFLQKEYFKRDFASKYYSWHSFAMSIVAVELPYIIVSCTIFFFCTYWTAGVEWDNSTNFYHWIMLCMFGIYTVSFGQALGAMCVNLAISIAILPVMLIYLFLFSGVQVPEMSFPTFWRKWAYHLDPTRYFTEGLVTNILQHTTVTCRQEDLVQFTPPVNQTCQSYTSDFISQSPGYVISLNDQGTSCGYCVYKNGADFYENVLGWDASYKWRNFGILAAYFGFNILLILVFVYLTRKSAR
ncbi:ABC transporter G family protein [Tieghemostelium lacteum]|uniref:ABC transporter G family protein n=1 Tax=Tieghemostelium lacteum TaxID=361077 RepID=A0A151ZBA2_TIELA|nr:ABC transporter G family protein [Tieghemostelium lacteum]|eukprot:KYQ91227.1 ABC transporter G family protein [Tieghemostelium lacteum]